MSYVLLYGHPADDPEVVAKKAALVGAGHTVHVRNPDYFHDQLDKSFIVTEQHNYDLVVVPDRFSAIGTAYTNAGLSVQTYTDLSVQASKVSHVHKVAATTVVVTA